jgi:hypothetical protein
VSKRSLVSWDEKAQIKPKHFIKTAPAAMLFKLSGPSRS